MSASTNPLNGDRARSLADEVARRSRAKLVAYLAGHSGDIEAAEDAVSDAFASALAAWPEKGCPANPEAWLLTAARRKLIDQYRRNRQTTGCDELEEIAAETPEDDESGLPDRRLDLLFACTHPAIDPSIRA
ncbi:MAG: sigma factor, partial [Terracidiphilus sp.]